MEGVERTRTVVTSLLDRARDGDRGALDEVFARVYGELHALARRQRERWRGDYTLGTTALVHEAYLKLVGHAPVSVADRAHFFALAARAMRHVLCNYARDRSALKRGGGGVDITLEEASAGAPGRAGQAGRPDLLVELDEALRALEAENERHARIVECRFFGGMTVEETAAALEVSTRTVKRDWALAQAWLHRAMTAAA
ncbi:MAG: ECF-type sigma factor [Gemmatimonadota bacterium]|nr:ECF-type sigma factor [Gemmatimonadota bacterium]MDH5760754.1 ECF-type sigma factor [Gemmatimonadota bacterium]